jgi:hypothetical protein
LSLDQRSSRKKTTIGYRKTCVRQEFEGDNDDFTIANHHSGVLFVLLKRIHYQIAEDRFFNFRLADMAGAGA